MKKSTSILVVAMLFSCAAFAQDTTTNNAASKQHHMANKKAINKKMPADSVNAGKITTNPNGKINDTSSSGLMKTHKKAMNSSKRNSKDSAR